MRGQIVTSPASFAPRVVDGVSYGGRVKYVRPLHWPHWTEENIQEHNPNGDIMSIGIVNCFGYVETFTGRIDEDGVLWEVDFDTKEWVRA